MLDILSWVTTEVAPENLQFTGAGFYTTDQILKLRQVLLQRQLISRKYFNFNLGSTTDPGKSTLLLGVVSLRDGYESSLPYPKLASIASTSRQIFYLNKTFSSWNWSISSGITSFSV